MKKILSIAGIALVIVAIGLASYYFFVFDKKDPVTGEKLGLSEFLPFGRGGDNRTDFGPSTDGGGFIIDGEQGSEAATQVFRQITDVQVAGAIPFDTTEGAAVRYVERATGNIFHYSTSTDKVRLTNTTIPKIREVVWGSKGDQLVLRYLSDDNVTVQSYGVELVPPAATTSATTTEDNFMQLAGSHLPQNIIDIVSLPSDKIFYLVRGGIGSYGYVSDINGDNAVQAFVSPIWGWIPQAVASDTVALTTRPAANTQGYSYLMDLTTGSLSRTVGGKRALMASVSPSGQYVLFADNSQGGFVMSVYNNETGLTDTIIIPASLGTEAFRAPVMPDKCTWFRDTAYCAIPRGPMAQDHVEQWMQGLVSPYDDLWAIHTDTKTMSLVYSPKDESDVEIDAVNLSVNESGSVLTLINKKDSSLWMLDLANNIRKRE